eukprot:TRINITY_DN5128_c1_g1_i2.p1 TRINITY_DN5128_c1_g1~~TRINITY_DN5128_c1_g1_i2.p1  ORF type:complete len:669 (-),score=138.73 TRINITY_DN5128_c1_g1_i2:49-2055(-)
MAFWKPGEAAPGIGLEDDSTPYYAWNPNEKLSIQQQRERLPIAQSKNHILYLLENFSTLIIVGSTGCGKTTQIPQFLHEAKWTAGGLIVACTQPRRVAAISVAQRVAEEMNCELGEKVGYSVRFEDVCSEDTVLKYMTDGMLVREMMLDPLLEKYTVIMLDEAHERSIYTDLLIGLLKKVQRKRKDLKLIISSATLTAESFQSFFHSQDFPATILSIEGRSFPVDIHYMTEPCKDYLEASISTVFEIHKSEGQGDILVFLTGQEEIEKAIQMVYDRFNDERGKMKLLPLPIFAGLPLSSQKKVFDAAPPKTRKVIFATNIAETSVTIDGIVFVIDCGFIKTKIFNPKTGFEGLMVIPISKANANQRSGRAGRNRPGKSYRLYSETEYNNLTQNSVPEIQKTNLATVLLQIKAMGIDNILKFDFLDKPPLENMARALELLYALRAIGDDARLTESIGYTMAEFPLEPMLSRAVIASHNFGCAQEIITIAAMSDLQNFWVGSYEEVERAKNRFAVLEGDHLTFLNIYNEYIRFEKDGRWCKENCLNAKMLEKVERVIGQLTGYAKRFNINIYSALGHAGGGSDEIRKSVASGLFVNSAKRQADGSYLTLRDPFVVHLHPSSVLFRYPPDYLVFQEIVTTSKEYMRNATKIEQSWLNEIAPHFFKTRRNIT